MRGYRRFVIAVAGTGLLSLVVATSAGAGVPQPQSSGRVATLTDAGSGTGNVSGAITIAATGKPLKGICVNVVEATGNTTVGTSAPTTKTGAWSLDGIPASTDYTAVAGNCGGVGKYVGQWYDSQNYQSGATQFAVSAGGTTTGIDFSLNKAGEITGKVTDSTTKKPVQGILVIALWTTDDSASTYSVCTSTKGTYKLEGVPTSGAKLEFLPNVCGTTSTYGTVFYLNGTGYDTATVVPVTAGQTTKNINQQMTAGS